MSLRISLPTYQLVLAFSLFAYHVVGQTYTFKPQWKVGDTKYITFSYVEKEFENNKLTETVEDFNEATVKVLSENSTTYTLEILYTNQALASAQKFYEKAGEELTQYRDLKLIYSINKSTAEASLQNWQEAQKFMNDSFDAITQLLEKKVPDEAFAIGLVFMPLKEIFKSKENIEDFMNEHIGILLVPYNKNFTIGKTISVETLDENPFNPKETLLTTTHTTLESVNTTSKLSVIKQKVELDLTSFVAMMKSMAAKMATSMAKTEKEAEEIRKKLESADFKFDIENQQVITYNTATTWITGAVLTGKVFSTDPLESSESRREMKTTIVVK